jgi:hypothetical protein
MRVLLINPPSPEQFGSPLLGLQYVAASMIARGCEVRIIDAAAGYFPRDSAWIVNEAERFAPRMVGVSLMTRWLWHGYRVVERLKAGRGCWSPADRTRPFAPKKRCATGSASVSPERPSRV